MAVEKASVLTVRKFIELNSTPVPSQELVGFWKSLTDEEKLQYTNEAIELEPSLAA